MANSYNFIDHSLRRCVSIWTRQMPQVFEARSRFIQGISIHGPVPSLFHNTVYKESSHE